MKQANILLISIITAFMVTGCGGSDGSKVPDNSNSVKKSFGYSDFSYSNAQGIYQSFIRYDYQIVDNVVYQKSPQQLIKSAPVESDFTTSYMADSKTLKSFRNTQTTYGKAMMILQSYDSEKSMTFSPYNPEKDTSFKLVGEYEIKDLSNVLIKDSMSEELLLLQSKLPSNLAFPQGAKCRSAVSGQFITPNANEAAVFLFDESDKTDFNSLGDWKADKSKKYTINPSTIVTGKAGGKYSFEGFKDASGNNFAGILYEGKVYETIIMSTKKSAQSFSECTGYNQVAADFIVSTVKKYNK